MIDHIAIAILIQVPVALGLSSWNGGAVAASTWAMSRELTQAEYRWIDAYGAGRRANMPWWGGFDPRVWQKLDPWLDFLAPTLAVIAIACLAHAIKCGRRG